jgi:hypothetical protein
MKIKVKVPEKEGGKWKVFWPGYGKHFLRADTLFNGIERRLLRRANEEKLAIVVDYGNHTFNETLMSEDAHYLLYTFACFLEDYLSVETLARITKLYNDK